MGRIERSDFWGDAGAISYAITKLTYQCRKNLKLCDIDAEGCVADTISHLWENRKLLQINTLSDVMAASPGVMKKIRNKISTNFSVGHQDDDDNIFDLMYTLPSQFVITYYNQILRAIMLLPAPNRDILIRIANGFSAIDISVSLGMPLHEVFLRIHDSRNALYDGGLIGIANDNYALNPEYMA